MWLPYQDAFEMAVTLALAVLVLRWSKRHAVQVGVGIAQELAIVLTLYGLWQYIHELAVTKTAGAVENAHHLWNFQRALHFPSEVWLEKLGVADG